MKSFFAFLILLLSAPCFGQENSFIWYKLDFPPYTIKEGTYKNRGLGDRIQEFVASRLPQFTHQTRYVTASRLYEDLKNDNQVCTVNSNYDVSSQQRRGISLPTNIYYNYHLVSRFEGEQQETSAVSLSKLLDGRSHRLLLDIARPYQHLDLLLKPYIDNDAIQLQSGKSLSGGILQKLDQGAADYTLELCSTVRYLSATEHFEHRFVCNEIVEHPLPIGRAAITCSQNEWGDKAIGEINAILQRYRGRREYMELMQDWYVPTNPDRKRQYWQHYRHYILSTTL